MSSFQYTGAIAPLIPGDAEMQNTQVDSDLKVEGDMFVYGNESFYGTTMVLYATTPATNATTAGLVVMGGLGVAGNEIVGSSISATNSTTAAFVVWGGIGAKGLYSSTDVNVSTNLVTTNTVSGGLLVASAGGVKVTTAGQGVQVAEGSNAKQGITTALGPTSLSVANTSVTSNSRIFLTGRGTTPGGYTVTDITPGVGFSIQSTVAGDVNQVFYEIFEGA